MRFFASVPLLIEFQSAYDGPWFSSDYAVGIGTASFRVGARVASVENRPGGLLMTVTEIEARDRADAATLAAEDFGVVAAALSMDLQGQHLNSHYGHPRFAWRSRDIQIESIVRPAGINLEASVATKTLLHFTPSRTQSLIAMQLERSIFRFLLNCYYSALAPTEPRSKFYNAFTIIEFVEANFVRRIATSALVSPELLTELGTSVEETLERSGVTAEASSRIRNRSLGPLQSATMESRASKLAQILNSVLGVRALKYVGLDFAVDTGFAKSLINARNRLFHAGEASGEIKTLADKLILTAEQVLITAMNEGSLLD